MGTSIRTRRRGTALVAAILGTALALAGCSTAEPGANGTTPAASSGAAFPVTIDTAYGEITVNEKPERIVAFGGNYLQFLYLIEEQPIAWANGLNTNEEFQGYFPWMVGKYEDEPDSSLITAEYALSVEAIAALEPDLILTNIWQADDQLYAQLSQIAPTYVGIETDTQTSWQDNVASLARLTGHDPAIVDELETGLKETYAAAAGRLPGLQGATYQLPVLNGEPPQLHLTEFGEEVFTGLGFVPGDKQPAGGLTNADVEPISQENVERLTADLVFVAAGGNLSDDVVNAQYSALRADPRVAELPSSQNGTLFYLTATDWAAINPLTPLGITWWLEQIVPQLEASALNQNGQ